MKMDGYLCKMPFGYKCLNLNVTVPVVNSQLSKCIIGCCSQAVIDSSLLAGKMSVGSFTQCLIFPSLSTTSAQVSLSKSLNSNSAAPLDQSYQAEEKSWCINEKVFLHPSLCQRLWKCSGHVPVIWQGWLAHWGSHTWQNTRSDSVMYVCPVQMQHTYSVNYT